MEVYDESKENEVPGIYHALLHHGIEEDLLSVDYSSPTKPNSDPITSSGTGLKGNIEDFHHLIGFQMIKKRYFGTESSQGSSKFEICVIENCLNN